MPPSTLAPTANPLQRLAAWLSDRTNLATVSPIPVGQPNDGLHLHPAGTPLDKPWSDLHHKLTDAREAWQKNPLARCLTSLITSCTVGKGITLQSCKIALQGFIDDFLKQLHIDARLRECAQQAKWGRVL